ncbi:hypothetical protein [Pedobacter boryungensis]|uniref:hypothetical protein n=1 Tax=Pedobacter boryungensis TaxID=869962 RepID=UPI001C201C15|nr:hypothetical protein [Pedobacter boryungensis]
MIKINILITPGSFAQKFAQIYNFKTFIQSPRCILAQTISYKIKTNDMMTQKIGFSFEN